MSATVIIDSQPKRSQTPCPLLDHGGGRSMSEIADEYFSTISPIGRKIITEKRKCTESHRRDWDRLTQKERDSILDEWFIDPTLQLKYELKFGKKTSAVPESFPRLKLEGSGERIVHYSTEHDDGSQTQNKKTVTWKDEFSGPFCWETKCQQELTIMTPATITVSSIPSPPISHDLIKVSDPNDETDAEWFAKASKDKGKLSVMLMRDVNNRNSLGNNLLASSNERLVFDQAVNEANNQKAFRKKDEKVTNNYNNNDRKTSQESLEGRKKIPKSDRSEKMKGTSATSEKVKPAPPSSEKIKPTPPPSEKIKPTPTPSSSENVKPNPPTSSRTNHTSRGSVNSRETEKRSGGGGKAKEKPSFASPSPRRDSGSKSIEMGSPRRLSGSKKRGEKKQMLPPGLMTELKQELKIQDNANFDLNQQREETGQGDAATEEPQVEEEEGSYEFLFDW